MKPISPACLRRYTKKRARLRQGRKPFVADLIGMDVPPDRPLA